MPKDINRSSNNTKTKNNRHSNHGGGSDRRFPVGNPDSNVPPDEAIARMDERRRVGGNMTTEEIERAGMGRGTIDPTFATFPPIHPPYSSSPTNPSDSSFPAMGRMQGDPISFAPPGQASAPWQNRASGNYRRDDRAHTTEATRRLHREPSNHPEFNHVPTDGAYLSHSRSDSSGSSGNSIDDPRGASGNPDYFNRRVRQMRHIRRDAERQAQHEAYGDWNAE